MYWINAKIRLPEIDPKTHQSEYVIVRHRASGPTLFPLAPPIWIAYLIDSDAFERKRGKRWLTVGGLSIGYVSSWMHMPADPMKKYIRQKKICIPKRM